MQIPIDREDIEHQLEVKSDLDEEPGVKYGEDLGPHKLIAPPLTQDGPP